MEETYTELKKNLQILGFPLKSNGDDQYFQKLFFKPSNERKKLVKWVAAEIKGLNQDDASKLSDKDLLQIYCNYVYMAPHLKQGFIEGTSCKDGQKKIWKAVLKDLVLRKNLRNTPKLSLSQMINFLKNEIDDNNEICKDALEPWRGIVPENINGTSSLIEDDTNSLVANAQSGEIENTTLTEIQPLPDLDVLSTSLKNIINRFDSSSINSNGNTTKLPDVTEHFKSCSEEIQSLNSVKNTRKNIEKRKICLSY